MVEEKQAQIDIIMKYVLFVCFFAFIVMGILSLDADPDFVVDKFMGAGFCLFFLLFSGKLGLKWYSIVSLLLILLLHHLKLYGRIYFGITFDIYMHLAAGFLIAIIVFQFLMNCEGVGCNNKWKLIFLAVFVTAGLGTVLEITEYFGYANLPPGQGILHFGDGDEGGWGDATLDMLCNIIGAVAASVMMATIYRKKRNRLRNLKLFITSPR